MGLHHGNRLTGDLPVLDVDTNFASNSLLINGEGNTSQNNTFINSIVPTGVGDYAVYFDGTGDYLSIPSNAVFDFGSGSYTIEGWINTTSTTSAGIITRRGTSNTATWQIYFNGASLEYWADGNTQVSSNSRSVVDGTWHHFAVVRNGTNTILYVDGIAGTTDTSLYTFPTGDGNVWIANDQESPTGRDFQGYLASVRVVKGTAVYTAAFTPPTSPLTAISGTSLLACQSATFIDTSTNAFTITVNGNSTVVSSSAPLGAITRYGNTTQGSFSPYGNNWSTYFDSNSTYLSFPSNTASNLGSSNFTFECWYYPMHTTGDANLFWWNGDSSGSNGWAGLRLQFNTYNGRTVHLLCSESASTWNINSLTGVVYSPNTWYHVAVVRNGATVTAYLNGTSIASGNLSSAGASLYTGTVNLINNMVYPANTRTAGGRANVSNVRMLKGTALYTSNFTPPSTPLTAITNTAVLTCQSNRFVDNSSNNFAVTPTGDVRVIKETPFPVAPYSASIIGGSGYFDGTGDYITAPNSSNFELNSGDYTVEFWFYPNDVASTYSIFGPWTYPGGWLFQLVNNTLNFYGSGGNLSGYHTSGAIIIANAWTHVACTRSGSTSRMFINGALVSTTTVSISTSSHPLAIGCNIGGVTQFYKGYVSDARIVKGTALYTSSFTPPTAPLTAVSSTRFLCNFTNAGVVDLTGENVIETVDGVQTSTTQKKYGSKSLYFDGTGDYLTIPANPNINITSGDFTIETWAYPTTQTNSVDSIFGYGYWTTMLYRNGSTWTWEVGNGSNSNYFTLTATCTSNTWQHIALTRSGNTYTFWLNGVAASTTTNSNGPATASRILAIGLNAFNASPASTQFFTGYIDDFRITKGVARYTTSFTPPTKALPNGTASTI